MPELPEVETVRRGLAAQILSTRIDTVQVLRDSCVRLLPGGVGEFVAAVSGASITAVARRGKFLWLPLGYGDDEPDTALSAHLGMSGQFRIHVGAAPPPHRHCRARLGLSGGLTLDFLDQRTFGYLHTEPLRPTPDARAGGAGTLAPVVPASVAHIGRDALDVALDEGAVLAAWRRGARGVKQVLLDQTLVSGIGNIYADEALWLARVHPQSPAHTLTAVKARRLLDAVRAVMMRALDSGGTSFDALYVNVNGESGYFARDLEAYGRSGEPCGRCAALITRERIGGRSTHWCPRCQRQP